MYLEISSVNLLPVQVKLDILQGRLPVPQELATELAALALQCKLHSMSTFLCKPFSMSSHL